MNEAEEAKLAEAVQALTALQAMLTERQKGEEPIISDNLQVKIDCITGALEQLSNLS